MTSISSFKCVIPGFTSSSFYSKTVNTCSLQRVICYLWSSCPTKLAQSDSDKAVQIFGTEVTLSQQTTFDVQNSHITSEAQGKNCLFLSTSLSRNSQKRLEHKKYQTNREKLSKRIGVMLELVYCVKNCPRWCLPLPFVCLPFINMHVVESMTSPVVITQGKNAFLHTN